MQKKQASFATEPLPNKPSPYVQQPLGSWDASQTSRVPPVRVPLPLCSNADADSARQPLSQPTARQPFKTGKARKSDTGAKPKSANDKISKLSFMVRLIPAWMTGALVIKCPEFELTCWPERRPRRQWKSVEACLWKSSNGSVSKGCKPRSALRCPSDPVALANAAVQ